MAEADGDAAGGGAKRGLTRRKSSHGWKHQEHPAARGAQESGSVTIAPNGAFSGKENQETAYCARYSHDGKYLAVGFGNGAMRIFDTSNWNCMHRVKPLAHNSEGLAMTCVRWRPHCPRKSYDLLSACSSGAVMQWTWDQDDPKADLEYQNTLLEDGNEIACCDYSQDGNMIVTAGSDHIVRVYDTMSTKLQHELRHGVDERGFVRDAHPSRIFTSRFVGPHTIVTAGWQTACQVWDLRTGKSERQLMGTHVCADSIDINFNTSTVVVASYRNSEQLKVFDYLSGRECTPPDLTKNLGDSMLYACRLCSDQSTLWCCGSKPNAIFQIDLRTGELFGSVTELPNTFFSCDLDPTDNSTCCFAGSKDSIMVCNSDK